MIDLTNLNIIKGLLTHYNVSAQKSLGQNFLIDKEVLDKITKAAELSKVDFVVEVGPGFGTLTLLLAEKAGRILAIETDKKILSILRAISSGYQNIDLLPANVLRLDGKELYSHYKAWSKTRNKKTRYKLVSNLPYYITSAVLKQFLETNYRPDLIVVMVQKEVAERIVAKPGEMSLLSLSVQFFGKPEIIAAVSKDAFWPKPKVDSAILKIVPHSSQLQHSVDDVKKFFRMLKAGFGERRKQLHNSLSGGLNINDATVQEKLRYVGISPQTRAQELSITQWVKLFKQFKKDI
ncbi:ribosomal RNA small subunit methyltransferase A [candidate division Kazan bacterium]|uniref:Ribosomal RNA small subunit methyltransferase A n=1 Tax=candidate division Kazan bacterium TaxID=2202143 RepID=A0A420ZD96_UNCK3|nr:MAG: ribosomal RNA small subunit methyltransferase A [candidate division Kazan bacterium]